MNKRFIFIYTILISAICCGGNSQAAGDSFVKDIQAMTANPHRLPGRADGSLAAGKYVLGRLKEIGFKDSDIFIQTFPVVQPIPTQCELAANGKTYPIYAARPNLIQAAITPAEGITAKTIYAAKGDLPAYGKNRPADKIVVLDFDCDQNWISAFAFGDRAVLFVGPKDGAAADAEAYHHVNMPANLPRFYVPYETANELDLTNGDRKGEVTIYSACQWKELRGCNVIAVLRGTNPIHSKDAPAQAVVLAAPLDSYSEVPELSPGAGTPQIAPRCFRSPRL